MQALQPMQVRHSKCEVFCSVLLGRKSTAIVVMIANQSVFISNKTTTLRCCISYVQKSPVRLQHHEWISVLCW